MPPFFTRSGDDGFTSLLGAGRYPKHDPRLEALGAIDEASAALGLARCYVQNAENGARILNIQRQLYAVMAEVAATPENEDKFRQISTKQVDWLEEQVMALARNTPLPAGFIVPGDHKPAAFLDLARTVVRRAERQVAALVHRGGLKNSELLRYLNRLSSLCFLMEINETVVAEGGGAPTLAKSEGEQEQ